MSDTQRIDLADGNWIEIRSVVKLKDIVAVEYARHDRGGFQSETLDALTLIESLTTGWSYAAALTPENFRDILDAEAIVQAAGAIGRKAD